MSHLRVLPDSKLVFVIGFHPAFADCLSHNQAKSIKEYLIPSRIDTWAVQKHMISSKISVISAPTNSQNVQITYLNKRIKSCFVRTTIPRKPGVHKFLAFSGSFVKAYSINSSNYQVIIPDIVSYIIDKNVWKGWGQPFQMHVIWFRILRGR